jgi:c-di-GMP-related signal transduction protein
MSFLTDNDKKEFINFLKELQNSNNEEIIKSKSVVEEILKNKPNKS